MKQRYPYIPGQFPRAKESDTMENPFRPSEKYKPQIVIITALFSFIGIAFLGFVDMHLHNQYIVASFGSTAVLIYAAPKAPFSKPKNVFFSHLFSALVSLIIVWVFDAAGLFADLKWIVCGLCVMTAILVMMFTGTLHPPAGATALTVAISHITEISFLVFPLAIGLLVMMAVAYGANVLKERYSD